MAHTPLNPETYLGGIQPLFSGDPLVLTNAFQNLGGEIKINGGKSLLLWLKIINNTSVDIQFKLLFLKTVGGDEYYPPLYLISAANAEVRIDENIFIMNQNIDQNPTIEVGLNNFVLSHIIAALLCFNL